MKKIAISVMILFAVVPSVAFAGIIDFDVKPANPVKGEVVTIAGQAQPDENVTIKVSFGNVVPVEDGRYTFFLPKINIPETVNRFTLRAEGCDDLKVSIKDYAERYPHWVTLSSGSDNGVAEVSGKDIPAVMCDVLVHGRSSQASVRITITVEGYEKADENGYFTHSYDTSSIPHGDFIVQVQNKSETAHLRLPTLSTVPMPIPDGKIQGSDAIGPFQVLLVIVAFVVPLVILALKSRK